MLRAKWIVKACRSHTAGGSPLQQLQTMTSEAIASLVLQGQKARKCMLQSMSMPMQWSAKACIMSEAQQTNYWTLWAQVILKTCNQQGSASHNRPLLCRHPTILCRSAAVRKGGTCLLQEICCVQSHRGNRCRCIKRATLGRPTQI